MRGACGGRLPAIGAELAACGRTFSPRARALLAKSSVAAAAPLVQQGGRSAAFAPAGHQAARRTPTAHWAAGGWWRRPRGRRALPRWQSAAARADGEGNGGGGKCLGGGELGPAWPGPARLGVGLPGPSPVPCLLRAAEEELRGSPGEAAAGGSAVCAAGPCRSRSRETGGWGGGSRGAGAAAAAAVLAGSRCWSILAWGCVCADGNFWRSRCVNAFGTGCCSDAEAQELCVRACTLSIAAAGTAGHCSVPRVDEGPCVALPLTGAACPHPLRSCCRHEF